jgi:nickel-dependent lactate racemase
LTAALREALSQNEGGTVLIIPPDLTRIHSRAGFLTGVICREIAANKEWTLGGIMPALGTHRPLTPEEIAVMFPRCPQDAFITHRWRQDAVELGRIPADWVETNFGGGEQFRMDFPVQVSRFLLPGSLIISVGQVVPHEVAGMANHLKNIFVGAGGAEALNKSHWLGALYGMERIMGVAENPVRRLFDEAYLRYGKMLAPIFWVLTVVDGSGAVRGLFTGFGREPYEKAAALSAEVNITLLKKPARKIVVRLDPAEYRSTWLGNKALYRTRMAIADGGELVILAPGVARFGEDPALDALIRKYGYRGTAATVKAVEEALTKAQRAQREEGNTINHGVAQSSTEYTNPLCQTPCQQKVGNNSVVRKEEDVLADNLSAAAHLVHGSSEGRFTVRYCTGENGLSRDEIESVGYQWGDIEQEAARAGDADLVVENPALGLWVYR